MENFRFYEVGGKIRDELLGLPNKDVDYVAVPNESLLALHSNAKEMFNILNAHLSDEGFEIFLVTPECFTIRAKFPEGHRYSGVADFVMARKEVGYIKGTRTPIVVAGSLYDDLERRDFTVNALAKDEEGNIIDFFNGKKDLQKKILRTPLNCKITFDDDPLRILRGIRFAITKGFSLDYDVIECIQSYDYDNRMGVVSSERIREELYKCFKFDTLKTLDYLHCYPRLKNYVFKNTGIWLKPTNEK